MPLCYHYDSSSDRRSLISALETRGVNKLPLQALDQDSASVATSRVGLVGRRTRLLINTNYITSQGVNGREALNEGQPMKHLRTVAIVSPRDVATSVAIHAGCFGAVRFVGCYGAGPMSAVHHKVCM